MNSRTKVLIANNDGAKLISLLLWLEQYTDLEVVGTTATEDEFNQSVNDHQPDVVLMDIGINPSSKAIRFTESQPAILLMHESDVAPLEGPLTREFDGQISPKQSLHEMADAIRKAANKRMLQKTASYIPAQKAG